MILMFAGETYYPNGGAEDLVLTADTLDAAIKEFSFVTNDYDWANAYDTETKLLVARWYVMSWRSDQDKPEYGVKEEAFPSIDDGQMGSNPITHQEWRRID